MIEIREPTLAEMEDYYAFRWKYLRKPWDQPLGSERDDFEMGAFHVLAKEDGKIIGVGRIHRTPDGAQIRYMAVDDIYKGRGVGSDILRKLHEKALEWGASSIVLNARENSVGFYEKNGYTLIGPAHTLFDTIKHFKMQFNQKT